MAGKKKVVNKGKETPIWEGKHCRDCSKKKVCHKHSTLSIHGVPTIARCPHVPNCSVLLSERACPNFKSRTICN